MEFLEELASRRRFGMKPGLETIRAVCRALGDPQDGIKTIHVAGTNGKGCVCAVLDAALRAAGMRTGRYTSPHLVKLNERFFLDGAPVRDELLQKYAARVQHLLADRAGRPEFAEVTYFEALTAVAFLLYGDVKPDFTILETGLGGRLDATNICSPAVSVITRIGLDHCDWLGGTIGAIAAEKAGIIKPGVPVVLGRNTPEAIAVVKRRAEETGAPFHYAPDVFDESQVPRDFSLDGSFNRENAATAAAALAVLKLPVAGFGNVVWPGRFQRVGRFIVDGAHNPPAARALAAALDPSASYTLVAGFCSDKDVDETLRILRPHVSRAIAVKTCNPRSLSPGELSRKMAAAGIASRPCGSLREALQSMEPWQGPGPDALVCGSLFLAGEALAELGAYPWQTGAFDPAEALRPA